jgi:hypothetical protein
MQPKAQSYSICIEQYLHRQLEQELLELLDSTLPSWPTIAGNCVLVRIAALRPRNLYGHRYKGERSSLAQDAVRNPD